MPAITHMGAVNRVLWFVFIDQRQLAFFFRQRERESRITTLKSSGSIRDRLRKKLTLLQYGSESTYARLVHYTVFFFMALMRANRSPPSSSIDNMFI